MRATATGTELKASAYAGTYVVTLAWDTLNGKKPSRTDLLGYAIERAEFDTAGSRGRALLAARDQALQGQRQGTAARHTRVRPPEHPVQGFHWADYTAKAAALATSIGSCRCSAR